ncbi:MAG: hypothetical protein WBW52_16000 [Desulfobaccales bacterium]
MPREKFVIPPEEMEITLDPDVQKILELMVVNVPPEKRVAVAIAVRELAEPLWKTFARPSDPFDPRTIFRGAYFRRVEDRV